MSLASPVKQIDQTVIAVRGTGIVLHQYAFTLGRMYQQIDALKQQPLSMETLPSRIDECTRLLGWLDAFENKLKQESQKLAYTQCAIGTIHLTNLFKKQIAKLKKTLPPLRTMVELQQVEIGKFLQEQLASPSAPEEIEAAPPSTPSLQERITALSPQERKTFHQIFGLKIGKQTSRHAARVWSRENYLNYPKKADRVLRDLGLK